VVEDRPVLILGTRTLALEIADLVSDTPGLKVAGFVENMDRGRAADPLEGYPVHWVDDIGSLATDHLALCGLATTRRSLFVEQVAELGFEFATLVHPTARVSGRTSVEEGTIVSAGAIVGAYTELGAHVLVNRGALIGHHTRVGDFASIQPGANIAGACTIGRATYIGMGAVVLDHTSIGSDAVVGAGAVVVKDVPGNVQVTGVPARVVKEKIVGK
jgi:sugar O-acyltransferase (sialic acid O-acetyltransferase NeuD family)